MTNEHYDLVKRFNTGSYAKYELQKNGKAIGKMFITRTKNDEFPNEIEVLHDGMRGKALNIDDKTLDGILATMRIPKKLVRKIEKEGYKITYDMGGA